MTSRVVETFRVEDMLWARCSCGLSTCHLTPPRGSPPAAAGNLAVALAETLLTHHKCEAVVEVAP